MLAGRYAHHFTNAMQDGERYASDDVVEIVPIAPRAAYVRAHIEFTNGHYCAIYGVARAEGDALVYRDPRPAVRDHGRCVLTVRRAGKSLSIDDGAHASCWPGNCGVRGSLTGVKLPYASKRPIRYLPRLKASREYRSALAEWRTGKPVEP